MTAQAKSVLWHGIFLTGYYLLCQPSHDGRPEYSFDTPGYHYLSLLVPGPYDSNQYYRFWHSWGAIMLVYSILRISWLQTFLNSRPLRYLGKVSFLLYLIHLPVIAIFGDRLSRVLGQVPPGGDEDKRWYDNQLWIPDVGSVGLSTRWLACFAIVLLAVLGIADLGTRYLDGPSVKLGKKLVQKLGLEKSGPSKEGIEGSEQIRVASRGMYIPL
jgi:peptidoglycan/LPS O-acetylase OafA/YrhL